MTAVETGDGMKKRDKKEKNKFIKAKEGGEGGREGGWGSNPSSLAKGTHELL